MPIQSGRRGAGGVLGVPALRRASALDPMRSMQATGGGPLGSGILLCGYRPAPFKSPPFSDRGTFITGVTRDSSGVAIGGVSVDLYLTTTDQKVDGTVSDGSGNFTIGATGGPYYLVAYKQGAPDVAGTSVNTLTGV
jgi:hypothetical protein